VSAAACGLEPVEVLSAAALAEVRRIYCAGFAEQLRADFASLTERRAPGEDALVLLRDGQPAGFALVRRLGDTGWSYLRYFVVDERRRGQGLGGTMWDRLMARLRAAGQTLLVFDVEDPDEPGCDPAEQRVRDRRIAFYQRHGARLLPVSGYRTPPVAAGGEWDSLRLLAAPVTPDGPDPDRDARAIVAAVYQYRWNLEPGHPRLAALRYRPDGDQEGC
jgi:GNAT superfamily N-acetyltransferase